MSEDTLKELIRTGKLTQEVADEARVKVDKTLQACAFALHTLMCNKEHEQDMKVLATTHYRVVAKKCLWYLEDQTENCWDAPDHNFWLTKTVEVMREQEIDGSEETRVFLEKLSEAVVHVTELTRWYPKSLRLLEEILKA